MNRLYVDHNATTPARPEVVEAMTEALARWGGNPSSPYASGREARATLEGARERIAALFGAEASGVVFTGSGTEADNLALSGAARALGRGTVVLSNIEHPAVEEPARLLEEEGFAARRVPVRGDGAVDPDEFAEALVPDARIASLIHGQNETGILQPVREVGRLCRARGVLFHTDAAQTAGKLPIDLREDPFDLVTIVGHKIYGPKGIAALLVREGVPLRPVLVGGGQEKGRRPGTESVALAVGLAVALECAMRTREAEERRILGMRDRFERAIERRLDGVTPLGRGRARIPGTSYLLIEGVSGGAVAEALDRLAIEISTGSACHSGSPEPSPVLLAMGIPRPLALGGIRIGFGLRNTEADVDRLVESLASVVRDLRGKGAP
ncbi:MAG: cysteine desulfurase [Candidatus Eisenbacteria bacterium]|nr:cysteine desulfurase [Candidatus Eisenbacteria bacterium]